MKPAEEIKGEAKIDEIKTEVEPQSWWNDKTRGRKLAVYWLITTLLGIGSIASTTGVARLIIPVLLLLAYAYRGYRHVESERRFVALRIARVGQLADSLYFLGFLWTLFALIDSFVIRQDSVAEAVFRSFGFALVTTASGMFLRLFMIQFGYSEEDQIALGERKVEEEIARFSKELRDASSTITKFRTDTTKALNQWIDTLNQSTTSLKATVDRVEEQTHSLENEILKIHAVSAQNAGTLVQSAFDQLTSKLQASLNQLNAAAGTLATELNASVGVVKVQISSGVTKLDQSVSKGIQRIDTSFKQGADDVDNSLDEGARLIGAATREFADQVSGQLSRLEKGLARVLDQLKSIEIGPAIVEETVMNELAKVTQGLSKGSQNMQKAMDDSALAISRALSSQVAAIEGNMKALAAQISNIRIPKDMVEKMVSEQITTASSGLARTVKGMETSNETSRSSAQSSSRRITSRSEAPWWKFWA